ncbi:MAG: hypothetical protein IT373_35600, partial [Polyangiaceae bacterium]|nr:hypothetical protein [Polyangiaceae bacterium]
MRRRRASLRRLGRTLLPLAVAYGAGLWLLGALLLELHVHRSTLLGLVSALPASGLAVWFSGHERRRFDRRAVVWAAVRGVLLFALFAGMLWLFDYRTKNRAAWAIWVPLMTLDFAPSMLTALPWLALGCLGGLFISYDLVVLRWRRLPFVVAYLWPAVWAFFAFTGFYRASFDTIDPAVVTRQPGVRILAPSGVAGCGLFAARCSNRIFPRAMGVDPRTRTLFAGFGSTASDLVRGQPMLLALEVDTGLATWLPGSDAANQIRNVAVDEAERLLAVGQWGSHRVALYDLERR